VREATRRRRQPVMAETVLPPKLDPPRPDPGT